jgi:hypothetical protein
VDPLLKERLAEILELEALDDVLSWELGRDGSWSKVPSVAGVNSQKLLMARAVERAASGR